MKNAQEFSLNLKIFVHFIIFAIEIRIKREYNSYMLKGFWAKKIYAYSRIGGYK